MANPIESYTDNLGVEWAYHSGAFWTVKNMELWCVPAMAKNGTPDIGNESPVEVLENANDIKAFILERFNVDI